MNKRYSMYVVNLIHARFTYMYIMQLISPKMETLKLVRNYGLNNGKLCKIRVMIYVISLISAEAGHAIGILGLLLRVHK